MKKYYCILISIILLLCGCEKKDTTPHQLPMLLNYHNLTRPSSISVTD